MFLFSTDGFFLHIFLNILIMLYHLCMFLLQEGRRIIVIIARCALGVHHRSWAGRLGCCASLWVPRYESWTRRREGHWLCYIFLVKLGRDLTRPGPPNGGLLREFPLFQGNLGWWNIIIWPDLFLGNPEDPDPPTGSNGTFHWSGSNRRFWNDFWPQFLWGLCCLLCLWSRSFFINLIRNHRLGNNE